MFPRVGYIFVRQILAIFGYPLAKGYTFLHVSQCALYNSDDVWECASVGDALGAITVVGDVSVVARLTLLPQLSCDAISNGVLGVAS